MGETRDNEYEDELLAYEEEDAQTLDFVATTTKANGETAKKLDKNLSDLSRDRITEVLLEHFWFMILRGIKYHTFVGVLPNTSNQVTKNIMGSLPTDQSINAEEQPQLEMNDDTGRTEKAQRLLNSPDPPSVWLELKVSISEAFFPTNTHSSSSSSKKTKKTFFTSAFSILRGLFPILH